MKRSKLVRLNRKWHRYLGLILGIQFLLWTIGGLYFSWTTIDEIRGDNLKNATPTIPTDQTLISPSIFLPEYLNKGDSLISLELTTILNKTHYRFEYVSNGIKNVVLVNAINGAQKLGLNKEESVAVAKEKLAITSEVVAIAFIKETGSHHEYRGRPLPAYAVTFNEPANTTVYVSTAYGNVQTFRNNQWRIFDFFWMLHTMDYQERDNFNNILIRAFAVFGLITLLSGFSLFVFTSKTMNKIRK